MSTYRISRTSLARLFKIAGGDAPPLDNTKASMLCIDFAWSARDLAQLDDPLLQTPLADGLLSNEELHTVTQSMIADGYLEEVPTPETPLSAADASALGIASLDIINQLGAVVAGDLAGLAVNDQALGGERGAQLARRLHNLESELRDIAAELAQAKSEHIATQRQKLERAGKSQDLKLNIGSGPSQLDDWLGVDMHGEVSVNLNWDWPFEDRSASHVFCSHVLEHFHYREQAMAFVSKIRRILQDGGVARFVVPDIELFLQAYANGDERFFAERKRIWPFAALLRTPLEHILRYAGAGVRPGDFFRHKTGYDFQTLRHLLVDAGFSRVEKSSYMGSPHEALRIDDTAPSAGAVIDGRRLSLFVEATR